MTAHAFSHVQGRSFPRCLQVLATLIMFGLMAVAWHARGALNGLALTPEVRLLAGLAMLVVVWQYLCILFSKTAITPTTLSQGWLWQHSVLIQDIAQVRWLRFKKLDALFAPRLMVRTRGHGNVTFHASEPSVLAMIELLVHGPSQGDVPACVAPKPPEITSAHDALRESDPGARWLRE